MARGKRRRGDLHGLALVPSGEESFFSDHYKQAFEAAIDTLPEELRPSDGSPTPARRPTVATTVFAQNQALGAWAEEIVQRALDGACGLRAVKYGEDSELIAGEPGFDEWWESYQRELAEVGKRCDLLLFERAQAPLAAPSEQEVRLAFAGLEVRASRKDAATTLAYQSSNEKRRKSQGPALSFTLKKDDIEHVRTWVRRYGVPHYLVQVLRDRIYAIPTLEALSIVADPARSEQWSLERRGNGKTSLYIDVACGEQIAYIAEKPAIEAVERLLPNGRIIDYVRRHGGRAILDRERFRRAFGLEAPEFGPLS
jgi:hypothetical protein